MKKKLIFKKDVIMRIRATKNSYEKAFLNALSLLSL